MEHEDLCLVPLGAEVCTCENIRATRAAPNPWENILARASLEQQVRDLERSDPLTIEVEWVETEKAAEHSKTCATWTWPGRVPCNCGLEGDIIQGELG